MGNCSMSLQYSLDQAVWRQDGLRSCFTIRSKKGILEVTYEGEEVLKISQFQIYSFHVNIFQMLALTHCVPLRVSLQFAICKHMKDRRWSLTHSDNPWTRFLLCLLSSGFIFLYSTGKLWCLLNQTCTSVTMIGTAVVTCMAASLMWRPHVSTVVGGEGGYSTAHFSLPEEKHWTRLLFAREGTTAL